MENNTETTDMQLEVLPPSALEAITRAEVDIAVATAKRYPRSLAQFTRRAIAMATIDEETAASCIYCRPVGKKQNARGQWEEQYSEGLSIRMAEIVFACYGNLRAGGMITEQTDRQVKGRGFCHDLETNVAITQDVIESTVKKPKAGQKVGDPYEERMRTVVGKATVSKALRDAIFRVVPRALAKPIEREVRRIIAGDAQSIASRRSIAIAWVTKLNVPLERVFAVLGIQGEEEMTGEHLVRLAGLKTAIKDKEVEIDEAFPPITEPKFKAPPAGDTTPPANAFAAAAAARTPAAPQIPPPATTVPPESTIATPETSAKARDEALKDKPDAEWGAAPARTELPNQDIYLALERAKLTPDNLADWAFSEKITKNYTLLKSMDQDTLAAVRARLEEAIAAIQSKLGGAK